MRGVRPFFQRTIDNGREWFDRRSTCCGAPLRWTPVDRFPQPPQADCTGCGKRVSEFKVMALGGGHPPREECRRPIPPPRDRVGRKRMLMESGMTPAQARAAMCRWAGYGGRGQ